MGAFNEYDYIARVESANTDEFAALLRDASDQEASVLSRHFGRDLYRRLNRRAMRYRIARSARDAPTRNKVVVIPGILGSQLTVSDLGEKQQHTWLNVQALACGGVAKLQLDESGRREVDSRYTVRASGILKRYYGELLLGLAECWDVHAFWYDWRQAFDVTTGELQAYIDGLFADDEPIYLVAHTTGGLIARDYVRRNRNRWMKTGASADGHKSTSKLVLLGVPNHGTFAAPLTLAGFPALIDWPQELARDRNQVDPRVVTNSFPCLYQLLPSPQLLERLYSPSTYGPALAPYIHHFEHAKAWRAKLAVSKTASDPERTLNVIGYNQPTIVGLHDLDKLAAYAGDNAAHRVGPKEVRNRLNEIAHFGPDGDGLVLLDLAELDGVPSLYVDVRHGPLSADAKVIAALCSLLKPDTGLLAAAARSDLEMSRPDLLEYARLIGPESESASAGRDGSQPASTKPQDFSAMLDSLSRTVQTTVDKQWTARVGRSVERLLNGRATGTISDSKRLTENLLTRQLLGGADWAPRAAPVAAPFEPPAISIHVICADFLKIDKISVSNLNEKPGRAKDVAPIDALAVGHYEGTLPEGVIGKLDQEISQALLAKQGKRLPPGATLRRDQLLLTQYAERGTLRGNLAQVFLLDDPRSDPPSDPRNGPGNDNRNGQHRTIAVAGMGPPGAFGEPELTVLVRELCWALGRLGKRRLATVIIGTGVQNVPLSAAAAGWIRGIKLALTGVEDGQALQTISFVINDYANAQQFHTALQREAGELAAEHRMTVKLQPLPLPGTHMPMEEAQGKSPVPRRAPGEMFDSPTRLTVSRVGDRLRFEGALSNSAAIAERENPIDLKLIEEANNELVTLTDLEQQLAHGQFLERLLIPRDLRSLLRSSGPLVMNVDRYTARLHWELLASPDPIAPAPNAGDHDAFPQFWAIAEGLTRQLRTGFAPAPEPPPPGKRMLRVLVVADPSADEPLPGAEEEGVLVADLFERFNTVHVATPNRVEVVRLLGPQEATRTNVLRHLLTRSYDVLHFAGHCVFDNSDPLLSGWIFTGGHRISASELSRIDRVPQFVFSNACQSGLTPDHIENRNIRLAPSFAEAFFQQGVSNFVCTAWPVDDQAARTFALSFYAQLLGLAIDGNAGPDNMSNLNAFTAGEPAVMYQAMRQARRAIARAHFDQRTWGAYQHYGNPYYRFFSLDFSGERRETRQAYPMNGGTDSTPPIPDSLRPVQIAETIEQLSPHIKFNNIVGEPRLSRLKEITRFLNVREARETFKVSGKGLAVAVLDTGLNVDHEDFQGRVIARRNFVTVLNPDPHDVTDTDGHGTHVAGLIAANHWNVGIAPEANMIPLKILLNKENPLATRFGLEPALDWVIAHHQEFRIAAVNISSAEANFVQAEEYENQESIRRVHEKIKTLRDLRIPVVISAGNRYSGLQGMGFPAIVPGAIAVGAVFDDAVGRLDFGGGIIANMTRAGQITPFSQRLHETVNPVAFTAVFAPGSRATSTGIIGNNLSIDKNGTSQAAPVTAGVILLMQELYLREKGELPPVDDLVNWLRGSGIAILDGDDEDDTVPHTNLAFVRIDALRALHKIKEELA